MRLCITAPNKVTYSETFIKNQIENLKPEYFIYYNWLPITVSNGENVFKGLFRIDILRKIVKNATPFIYQKIYNRAFYNFLVSHKIDAVLAEYGLTGVSVMEACKKANCRLVVHYHGFDAFDKKTLSIYSGWYKELFKIAHKIIAVSGDMQNQLVKLGAPENKVLINSYGVDINKFSKKLGFQMEPVVIAVGRFTAKKSPQNTINAFYKVLQVVPNAKLVMIGDGELFEESKKQAEVLKISKSIDFKGVLGPDGIIEELDKARIFVQHSVVAPNGDSEGLPNSILEAEAMSLPVVSTFHAGIPEAVKDKVTGFLVKEHDVEGMAKYMIELLTNDSLAIEMGNAARKHVTDNYSLENQIAVLHNVLAS